MIIIKSPAEIQLMRESGAVTGAILRDLARLIKPGVSTKDIADYVEKTISKNGMTPTFKGYNGFPASACVSVNEEVIHGIPRRSRLLRAGDIVSVDIGATWKGYVSDAARTYAVGAISDEARRLIDVTEACFFEGLKYCRVGCRLSDISHAIQSKAESEAFSVVRDFVGHGVGRNMHEEPQIPNYGKPGRGPRLAPGMVFAIEPMVNAGACEVEVLLDNWTAVTADGSLSAHYENTVVITDGDPELLTLEGVL
ncbi:MAG: type I methionyl aminopeptidase [Clostridiales Family XIII bacterium]|jgi:methionyl aminopeptidase|nr:type I methionyl aminopeptidase [Clostridiales Family XIII bacterium]